MTRENINTLSSVPHFRIDDNSGRYVARRSLTDAQIIKAAKVILANKVNRTHVLTDAGAVKDYLITHYSDRKCEAFICLFCDNKHRLITDEVMFTGTIDRASVYSREVVRRAIELNAAAVIFAHNHPSGNPEPSQADLTLTEKLKAALQLVDIRTLDHVIVGGGEAFSFAELGIL